MHFKMMIIGKKKCINTPSNLYPFHIKPIMRSQRRFENNAVWCERSEAALFDTGVRKGAFYVGGLLLPREVFWKRILAKSRSLRRFGCQCERVHRIMRRERPNNLTYRIYVGCLCIAICRGIHLHFCREYKQRSPTTFQNYLSDHP